MLLCSDAVAVVMSFDIEIVHRFATLFSEFSLPQDKRSFACGLTMSSMLCVSYRSIMPRHMSCLAVYWVMLHVMQHATLPFVLCNMRYVDGTMVLPPGRLSCC